MLLTLSTQKRVLERVAFFARPPSPSPVMTTVLRPASNSINNLGEKEGAKEGVLVGTELVGTAVGSREILGELVVGTAVGIGVVGAALGAA
jgi:hypothetical protein